VTSSLHTRAWTGQPRPRIYSRNCAPTSTSNRTAADASASPGGHLRLSTGG
jgi:hypothetical protein